MLPVNDFLDQILLGAFFFGLLFSALSVFLGASDIGGDASADAGNGNGHHHLGEVLNISSILAFVAWFGGIGYIVRNGLGWIAPVALGVGLLGGVAGAALVVLFLRKVIAPAETALDPRDYEMPGTLARITSSIRAGGTGEVVYEQAGYRHVAAARSLDGVALDRATEVVIMEIRAGIAYVQPWTDLIAEHDQESVRANLDDQFRALDAVEAEIATSGERIDGDLGGQTRRSVRDVRVE